jgi:hypothetical protein
MFSAGAARRAALPTSSARAEASRKNDAKSSGPKTPEGKRRSAQNALRHGMRAQKYVVLPEEDAAAFAALEAALAEELAPQGVLQSILVGRIARAAWRLDRAERIEVDLFAERLLAVRDGGVGLALIRDGNCTRSFETLLRYRGAARLRRHAASALAPRSVLPNERERHRLRDPDQQETERPPAPAPSGVGATDSHGRMDRLNKCRTYG